MNAKYGNVSLSLTCGPLPDEMLNPTPSKRHGMDEDIETDLRFLGSELIQTAGILLRLPQVAMTTGQILFQRFYYCKSFVLYPMGTTAMACTFLASKIEEVPRRIRDVINVFHHIRQVTNNKIIKPMILDQHYIDLKKQVIEAEMTVLKELGFCVQVKHPHKIMTVYLHLLDLENHQSLVQLSWNCMNDALRSDVFVRYVPEAVACACICLSAQRLKIPLPMAPAWYEVFHVTQAQIEDLCQRIMRLYNRSKPNFQDLERKVEELKKDYKKVWQRSLGILSSNNTPHCGARPADNILYKNNHSVEKRRDRRSRSRSRNRSRNLSKQRCSKKHSRGRSRSRSFPRSRKSHKSRRSSYTTSLSPSQHKQQEKRKYRSRSRSRTLIRSRI